MNRSLVIAGGTSAIAMGATAAHADPVNTTTDLATLATSKLSDLANLVVTASTSSLLIIAGIAAFGIVAWFLRKK